MKNERIEIFLEVAKLVAKYDIQEGIFWHDDLTVFALCDDTFWWATSDCEKIGSKEDVKLFEESVIDCNRVSEAAFIGPQLYAARKRGSRPQGAAYPKHPALIALFDMCGPKRELNLDNPKDTPQGPSR
jgi:hypothetical protein